MASLFDQIKSRLSQGSAQRAAEKTLAVKQSGKIRRKGGPKSSRVAEQAAQSQLKQAASQPDLAGLQAEQQARTQAQRTEQAGEELQQRGELAREQLQAQAQQAARGRQFETEQTRRRGSAEASMTTDRISNQYQSQMQDLLSKRGIAEDDIFEEFRQARGELDLDKERAALEELGHNLALQDRKYTDTIQRIGKVRRLKDAGNFQKEVTRLTVGNQLDRLFQQLDWKEDFNATNREWEEKMTKMGAADALRIVEADARAANNRMVLEALAGVGAAGVEGYEGPSESGGGTGPDFGWLEEGESASPGGPQPTQQGVY